MLLFSKRSSASNWWRLFLSLCIATFVNAATPNDGDLMTVITVATDGNHFGYKTLKRSLETMGYSSFKTLGLDQEWIGEDIRHYASGGVKIAWMQQHLFPQEEEEEEEVVHYEANDIIVFTDGYDTQFQQPPRVLYDAFIQMEKKHSSSNIVMFGAEVKCWPNQSVCDSYRKASNVDKYSTASLSNPYQYLNSGTYMGRVKDIRKLIQDFDIQQHEDDQQYFGTLYAKSLNYYNNNNNNDDFIPKILIDSDCHFFQTLDFMERDQFQVNPSSSSSSQEHYYYEFVNTRLITHRPKPVILHGNGPAKRWFVSLTNMISRNHHSTLGTLHHDPKRVVPISPFDSNDDTVSTYPLVLGLFLTGQHDKEEEFLIQTFDTLDLDWKHVHLFIVLDTTLSRVPRKGQLPIEVIRQRKEQNKAFASIRVIPFETNEACGAHATFFRQAYTLLQEEYNTSEDDYGQVMIIDSEVFVTVPTVVQDLTSWNETIVVGHAQRKGKYFSNFWTAATQSWWYQRGFDTIALYNHDRVGLWQVPFAWGLALYSYHVLESMADIMKKYNKNEDAFNCQRLASRDALHQGIGYFVDNHEIYGTIVDEEEKETKKEQDKEENEKKDGVLFPQLFNAHTRPEEWKKRYLVSNYPNLEFEQVCPDVYGAVLFNERFCKELVATVEAADNWSSGSNNDHRNGGFYEYYPTQDIHTKDFGWEENWKHILFETINPYISKYYGRQSSEEKLLKEINLAFVVRYTMNGQRKLEPHQDHSLLTTTVLLSNNFTGSGVTFTRYNCSVHTHQVGYLLIHPGMVTHQHTAHDLESGTRHVLVSFNF